MVLGYEKPVDIPVMSIYDKDMMKTYLGALQKDYEQGLQDMRQANTDAANFSSPIAADNEDWYNITSRPIKEFLDKNPNAIRSVEGRAWIRNFINSRPYGDMAKLRQSAENAKTFNAAVNKMRQDGTYSEELSKFFGEGYDGWRTLGDNGNGVFNTMAPTKYVGMEEALLPTIQMLQKSYRLDEEASKKRPGYNVFNVSEKQAREAINRNYVDLMRIPAMKYHLAKSGLTEDQFKDLLTKQALAQTPEKLEADQWAMLQAKLAAEAAENAKNRAHQRAMAKDKQEQTPNMQLTDRIQEATQTKQNTVDAPSFIDYFSRLYNAEKDPNKKAKYKGYLNEWRQYGNNPEKDMQFLKKYGYMDQDGNITKKYYQWHDRATGAFREKGVQTRAETIFNSNQFYTNNLVPVTGAIETEALLKHMAGSTTKQKNGYYGVTFGKGIRYSTARALDYAGGTVKSSLKKTNSVHYVFDNWLNNNHIRGNAFDTGGLMTGVLPGNVLEVAGLGVTVKKENIEKFIKAAKDKRVYLSNGKNIKNATDEEILSDLGLSVVDNEGHEVSWKEATKGGRPLKDDNGARTRIRSGKESQIYIRIPTSSSVNMIGTNTSDLNIGYNKDAFGGGSAYKELQQSDISSVIASGSGE